MQSQIVSAIALRNSITQTCAVLNLSRATLYDRIKRGLIRVTKDGGRTFISGQEIERYLAACAAASPDSRFQRTAEAP